MERINTIIMGGDGKEFHLFHNYYQGQVKYDVVLFTSHRATAETLFPAHLAGELYPDGIPIVPEEGLRRWIRRYCVDEVVFAYSDITYEDLSRREMVVRDSGADFKFCEVQRLMVPPTKPSIAVCAARPRRGKSHFIELTARILREQGSRPVVAGYPAMEGWHSFPRDVQSLGEQGDVLLWEAMGNDIPFIAADLYMVLADAGSLERELAYYPAPIHFELANVIVLNHRNEITNQGEALVRILNPSATVVHALWKKRGTSYTMEECQPNAAKFIRDFVKEE